MNQNNYASLEASKRLVEAGIVLETEFIYYFRNEREGYLLSSSLRYLDLSQTFYPAPSMAEVWRELPIYCGIVKVYENQSVAKVMFDPEPVAAPTRRELDSIRRNTNPADALIDLLIWVRKEKP